MAELVTLLYPLEGVALVTMTNPRINNNGSWKGIGELADAMIEARENGKVRATVLASGVPGHWFEHAWLQDLADGMEGKSTSAAGGAFPRVLDEMRRPEVVVIAAISGDCSGGGAEIGWACDLRIAEEQAVFGQPEIHIGLTTGRGGTSRLARLIGRAAAAEMVMLGLPLSARRIHTLGGVNAVVSSGQAVAVALQWGSMLAAKSPQAMRTLKQVLVDNDDMTLTAALENEQSLFMSIARTPQAIARMREIQARFDAGESLRGVYGEPQDET
jgi:enoyl-CoA hydratase/carnithine racemase